MNKREKFGPGLGFTESSQHGGRNSSGVLFLNAAHHHAHMSRFNDYPHALRFDSTLNRFSNLCCQTFLHL